MSITRSFKFITIFLSLCLGFSNVSLAGNVYFDWAQNQQSSKPISKNSTENSSTISISVNDSISDNVLSRHVEGEAASVDDEVIGTGAGEVPVDILEVWLRYTTPSGLQTVSTIVNPNIGLTLPTIPYHQLTGIRFRMSDVSFFNESRDMNTLVVQGKNTGVKTFSLFDIDSSIFANELTWTFTVPLTEDQYQLTFLPTSYRLNFNILPSDTNQNGEVDAADYVLWRNNNGTSTSDQLDFIRGDINHDLIVNEQDNDLWRSKFGVSFKQPHNFNPAGLVSINHGAAQTNTPNVNLFLDVFDDTSTSANITMAFSTDGLTYTSYEPFHASKNVVFSGPSGIKTVYVRFRDQAGNVFETQDQIIWNEFVPLPPLDYVPFYSRRLADDQPVNEYGSTITWVGDFFAISIANDDPNEASAQPKVDIFYADLNKSNFGSLLGSLLGPTNKQVNFGSSINSVGDLLLLGIPGFDWNGSSVNDGIVQVVDLDSTSILFGQVVKGWSTAFFDSGARFGENIVTSGTKVFIAAPNATYSNPPRDAGEVHFFDGNLFSTTFGQILRTFRSPNANQYRKFGKSISVVGDYVAISAEDADGVGQGTDAVFVYNANPASSAFGQLVATIKNPTSQADAQFGIKLGTFGNYLLVGAGLDNVAGINAGAVHMYDLIPSSPTFGTRLRTFLNPTPRNISNGEGFGQDVLGEVDGYLMIGASRDNSTHGHESGALYFFDGNPASPNFGNLVTTLSTPAALTTSGDRFGASAVFRPDGLLLVGTPGRGNGGVVMYRRSSVPSPIGAAAFVGEGIDAPLYWQVTRLGETAQVQTNSTDSKKMTFSKKEKIKRKKT